jgi:hypothetical protein
VKEIASCERSTVINQQVHILAGDGQESQDDQKGGLHSINKFTYILEMGKRVRMIRREVCTPSTSSHTNWRWARESG